MLKPDIPLDRWWQQRLRIAMVALVYGLCGVLAARGLVPGGDSLLAPVWLPAGVALAATIRWGTRVWPGLLLAGVWLAHGELGLPWWSALLLAAGNVAGPVLAASLLRRRQCGYLPFYRLSCVLYFLGYGVYLSPLLAALSHALISQPGAMFQLGRQFVFGWLSHAVGTLLLTPLLLFALTPEPTRYRRVAAAPMELGTVALVTLVLAALVSWLLTSPAGLYAGLPYLFIIPLLWVAFRARLALAHALSLAIILLALGGAMQARGAFYIDSIPQAVLAVGMLALVQSITLLIVGALLSERRHTENWLRQANQRLENKMAERNRQLAESEARLQLMADASPFPMVMNVLSGELIYANARAEELFKSRLDARQPLRVQDFYVDSVARSQVSQLLRRHGSVRDHEIMLRDASGREFWALVSCSVIKSAMSRYVITGINDISERKRLEKNLRNANQALRQHVSEIETLQQGLREQALRDPLTGLFNRRYLDDTLPPLLAKQREVAVLMLDADHFKRINDTHGHKSGDRVLSALGAHLSDRFRSSDVVCRYGGEEFLILLPGSSLESAYAKAEELCREVRQMPIAIPGNTLHVTLSIGVAVYPLHGNDAESMIYAADAALYQAKHQGRDRVCAARLPQQQSV